jgi:Domain of unknown function (DUF4381)
MTALVPALASLRDIHLAEPVTNWPPPLGWLIVGFVALLALVLIIRRMPTAWKKYRVKRYARELIQQWQQAPEVSDVAQLMQLNALLKRVARQLFPTQQPAQLYGSAWLEFLNHSGRTKKFSKDPGGCFAEAHYRPSSVDIPECYKLAQFWLRRV